MRASRQQDKCLPELPLFPIIQRGGVSITEFEEYQEDIQYMHNTFCGECYSLCVHWCSSYVTWSGYGKQGHQHRPSVTADWRMLQMNWREWRSWRMPERNWKRSKETIRFCRKCSRQFSNKQKTYWQISIWNIYYRYQIEIIECEVKIWEISNQ